MLIHHKVPISFRVTAWPKAKASHFGLFTNDKLQYNMEPLIAHLAEALFNTGKTFTRYATFGLVNTTSRSSLTSYGKALPPNEKLLGMHRLAFTFAFTAQDLYDNTVYPKYRVRTTPFATVWGNHLNACTDFCTIMVPKRVLIDCGLAYLTLREMRWLHMLIGAWSKGFVDQNKYFTLRGPFRYRSMSVIRAKSSIFQKRLPHMFMRVNYDLWQYNEEVWKMCPNVLSPRAVSETFCIFYCKYLRQFYRKYSTANVKQIERAVEEFVESGVVDLLLSMDADGNYLDAGHDTTVQLDTVLELLHGKAYTQESLSDTRAAVVALLDGSFGN